MLTSLSLSQFMVFEKAEFELNAGLSVITGETGAGKSTILNALKLILGGRADTSLIRSGNDEAMLIAVFTYQNTNIFREFCALYDIPFDHDFIIRRILRKSKPNRAYINDVPVTTQTLYEFGRLSIEICGQFDDRETLSPTGFRILLDSYLADNTIKTQLKEKFNIFKSIEKSYITEQNAIKDALREQDYLKHVLNELDQLNPQKGEEEELAGTRQKMMSVEKNMTILQQTERSLSYDNPIESHLLSAIKSLSVLEDDFPDILPDIVINLNEAYEKASLATDALSRFNQSLNYDPDLLSQSEERLFALRAAARKHHISVEELYDLHQDYTDRLNKIDHGEALLLKLEKQLQEAKDDFMNAAHALSKQRKNIAPMLEENIAMHLRDLNLASAQFRITFSETAPSGDGIDHILFEIASGPSMPFGAVHKTASGGEMSRIMLAIKASLRQINPEFILIFDEIDRGVGGATAEAVGIKLRELSQHNAQLIVITHSPQVAAKGDYHFHIVKTSKNNLTTSELSTLSGDARYEEIARMLSGAKITDEARAAANKLFET